MLISNILVELKYLLKTPSSRKLIVINKVSLKKTQNFTSALVTITSLFYISVFIRFYYSVSDIYKD
jgi:hypothetical protein